MTARKLAFLGVDECGSLSAEAEWFVLAGVLTYAPGPIQRIIRRAAVASSRRLKRTRHAPSEFKWSNASLRFRQDVLLRLAAAEVEAFGLTIHKAHRRIDDVPENYAVLVVELLSAVWAKHPNIALKIDRRYTAPGQIAVLDTQIYRHWPPPGVLSIEHVDSQRSPLVQLADFVAGGLYAGAKTGANALEVVRGRISADWHGSWPEIKQRWTKRGV